MAQSMIPIVFWAQRKDRVLVTVDVQDCQQLEVSIQNSEEEKAGQVHLSCKTSSTAYNLQLTLYKQINAEESKYNATPRNIQFILIKQDDKSDFWPFLTKNQKKESHIRIDWSKWIDEDEENTQEAGGDESGDFDPMSAMGGMGGMPGMPGGMGGMPGMPGGMGGMPGMPGGMGGMPGMPGMGGMPGMPGGMGGMPGGMGGMPGMEGLMDGLNMGDEKNSDDDGSKDDDSDGDAGVDKTQGGADNLTADVLKDQNGTKDTQVKDSAVKETKSQDMQAQNQSQNTVQP